MLIRNRRSLRVIFLIALSLVGPAYWLLGRPWHIRWGATEAEIDQPLPGDEIVKHPRNWSTRAITIHAPAAVVWPWLLQIGQGRGGLYSYDWLENLAGCDIHTADRIIPEFQQLQVGDKVRLGPDGYPFFAVAAIEPGRALVLGGNPDPRAGNHSWVFFLDPIDETTTRLIVRSRGDYPPTVGNFVIWRVITEPLQFVMERKMLLGIKQRADG
jgi:hypothetical protein